MDLVVVAVAVVILSYACLKVRDIIKEKLFLRKLWKELDERERKEAEGWVYY